MADQPSAPSMDMDMEEVGRIVSAMLEGGQTLKEIRNLEDRHMEAVYSVAFNFYDSGKFDEAERAFKFLCLFEHVNPKYWMGLAATLQMKRDYLAAIQAYSQCGLLEPEDPLPPMHAGECYLALGNLEYARAGLESAVAWCGAKAEHAKPRQRAEALLSLIDERERRTKRKGASE